MGVFQMCLMSSGSHVFQFEIWAAPSGSLAIRDGSEAAHLAERGCRRVGELALTEMHYTS